MTKRISVGERLAGFPAETWNQLVDAMGGDDAAAPQATTPEGAPTFIPHAHVVQIVNKSGASVREFEILGIDDAALDPPDIDGDDIATATVLNGVRLECVTPTVADHQYAFVVSLEPIANNGVGRAVVSGLTWARVNVSSSDHTCAEFTASSSTEFASSAYGPLKIVWKASGTGSQWCAVLLGEVRTASRIRGTLTADCTGGTFSMDGLIGINGAIPDGVTTLTSCANPYSMEGDEDGAVSVEWNENATTPNWEAYQMACPE